MWKWPKRLAGAGSCLIAGILIAGTVFLGRPELLLTSRTAGAALRHFGAAWAPRWSHLRFSAEAFERRRHRYVLSATDFCINDSEGSFSGCLTQLELSAVVFYSWRGPVVERLERIVAVAERARLDLGRREPKGALRGILAALRSTPVEALRVELPRFTLTSSKTTVSGGLRAVLTPGGRRPLSVKARLLIRGPEGARRLKGELTADTDLLKGGAPTYVDLIGRADLGPRGRVRASFRVRREALRYVGSGSAEVTASSGPMREIRLAACKGSASRPSGAELSCRYELVLAKSVADSLAGLKAVRGDVSLGVRLEGESFQAALKAAVDPIVAWYELTGDLAVKINGRLDRSTKTAAVSHEIRAAVKVARFEDVVALLAETKYAVPAPVHVLKGPFGFSLESRGDPRADRQSVRYVFSSDLAGSRQRLILRAEGDLRLADARRPGRSFEHAGELILKEVALELPRLEIERAPKFFIDKRIKTGEDEIAVKAPKPRSGERGALPLRSGLIVKTEKPMILFSNLAKDPVPLALDLIATYPPAAAAGRISVRKFDIELFRRNATIDHLNISMSSGSQVGVLEGLVLYKTPAAAISILVLGTTAKPRVEFVSVPPMKREDIIALLIFGKSPDELDLEQTASVRNTETALESQAFGLASLYLFGVTPIEYVGYDSATRTASVKLRLPGGANLELGSDFDQSRELRLRKPLAPHWAIQSEITDQGRQSKAATTFLEWFNRY